MSTTMGTGIRFEPDERLLQYHGRSMWPLFREGDLIVVRPVAPERLRIGDCIAFQVDGADHSIVHRIIGLLPLIRTKGDHRLRADDGGVSSAAIQGRVVAYVRYGKRVGVSPDWRGRLAGSAMQWLARLDPARDARLGRCARLLRAAVSPLAERWLARAVIVTFASPSGAPIERLIVDGRPVATFDSATRLWQVDWSYRLWIAPHRLPDIFGQERRESNRGGCRPVAISTVSLTRDEPGEGGTSSEQETFVLTGCEAK